MGDRSIRWSDVRTDETCTVCGSFLRAQGSYKYCPRQGFVSHMVAARSKEQRILPPAPPETLSAAEYLWECGEISGALEMFRFFEKPSRFPELLALYDDEVCRQGEAYDEFKQRAP